ncbi:MAG: HAMP domain-containing sensor histidine kinase [Polyangiales bacterium]
MSDSARKRTQSVPEFARDSLAPPSPEAQLRDERNAREPVSRLIVAALLTGLLSTLAFAALSPLVAANVAALAALPLFAAGAGLSLSTIIALPTLFARSSLERAAIAPESADEADADAVYAAPQRAVQVAAIYALATLLIASIPLPQVHSALAPAHWILAGVCAFLAAPLGYVLSRAAVLPLAIRLSADTDYRSVRSSPDRVASRLALAFAAPAAAATLAGALLVETRIAQLRKNTDDALRDQASEILAVSLRTNADDEGVIAAVQSLRRAGLNVRRDAEGRLAVMAAQSEPTTLPSWGLLASLAAVVIAAQLGARVGRDAANDVSSAAERMNSVSAKDMRSVTMRIARPKSVPEVRDMALALDTLAAALLRMNEDRERALIARREAARVRSFVLASVSHDLRAPLNSVLGFADLVLSGTEGPVSDEQRESLEALQRGGHELLRLVRDFLDQARLDADRLTLDRARASVDTIVERARAQAIERSRVKVSPDALTIEGEVGLHLLGDEERLTHAAASFVAFALMRSGSNGHVVLRVRGEGDTILLTVRGGGTTPSREALRGMFEPFDFAPAGARAPAGLSLAVNVARGVIRLHGGAVLAEPVEQGGIVITVTLPIAATES